MNTLPVHFKNTFGITPEAYRNHPQTLNRMTKPELLLCYTLADEGMPLITEGIVLEMNRRQLLQSLSFIGFEKKMPVQFADGLGTESGVDPLGMLWQDFHTKKECELNLGHDVEEIGVLLPCPDAGYFTYFVGAKAGDMAVPDGFTRWELPQGEYVVCTFEAENFDTLVLDALYKAQHYVYDIWLPKHDLQSESFCAERYETSTPQTSSMEIWQKLRS